MANIQIIQAWAAPSNSVHKYLFIIPSSSTEQELCESYNPGPD